MIHTLDGASYKLPTVDDVIKYRYTDSRRIGKIDFNAEKSKERHGYYPLFLPSLYDREKHDLSCILILRDFDEAEIPFLNQRINEFVKKN